MDILEQVAVGLLALGIGLAFAFAGWKWFLILCRSGPSSPASSSGRTPSS